MDMTRKHYILTILKTNIFVLGVKMETILWCILIGKSVFDCLIKHLYLFDQTVKQQSNRIAKISNRSACLIKQVSNKHQTAEEFSLLKCFL
jgi:hypothetical protein